MADQSDTVRDILLIIATVLFVSFILGGGGREETGAATIPIITPE